MNKIATYAAAVGLLFTATLSANTLSLKSHDNIVPLVELYTSEGCSSCPPADRALSELAQNLNSDFRAVTLGYHVDYWDYLGWPDKHAKKAYTQRQREKAKANKQRTIYTPEFFVAGVEMRGGAGRLVNAIESTNQIPASVDLQALVEKADEHQLQIVVTVDNQSEQAAQLQAVLYENAIKRDIKAGENRGVLMHYDSVVREHSEVRVLKKGQAEYTFMLAVPKDAVRENLGVAIFAETRPSLATLQAMHAPIASVFE